MARMLAERGASELWLSYRSDEEGARKAAAEITALGAKCHLIQNDLSEEGAHDRLFDAVTKDSDRLDYYVHNAAATAFKDLADIKAHHIDKTLNITVKSFILGMQRAALLMKDGGAVVTISGMDTLKAVPRHGLLGAAKSAPETLTMYYAHEFASKKIRVNGVNPGFIPTDSTRKYLGPMFDMVNGMFAELVPLKREAKLDEVSEAVLFLLSPRAQWIVGQTLCVDGGLDYTMLIPAG